MLFGILDEITDDEESQNGREVKIDIYDDGIQTPEVFRAAPGTYRVTGRGSRHPRQKIWALWDKEKERG